MSRIGIVIPTRNAGAQFHTLLGQLARQTAENLRVLVIDSGSRDGTPEAARSAGCDLLTIQPEEFNHGATRQMAFWHLQSRVDVLVYLTQDVLLADEDSIRRLVQALEAQPDAGAAYGRQLPHAGASLEARLQRAFNYPAESRVKSLADRSLLGIKTPYLSDSFAAYRRSALAAVGGFPVVEACEDMYVGGRLLLAGYTIVYAADAAVHHSHEYTLAGNFSRYYTTGHFHGQEPWLRKAFGGSGGEGLRLLRYQLRAAWREGGLGPLLALVGENAVRYGAYSLGLLIGRCSGSQNRKGVD